MCQITPLSIFSFSIRIIWYLFLDILEEIKLYWNLATFRGQRVGRYYWILRIKKTINQGQNEFQQISGRVKVIIQTLDDTYLKYLYKGQFSNGYKSNLRAGGTGRCKDSHWLPKICGRDTGGLRLHSTNFGSQGFRVIRGIMLIGDWFRTKTREIDRFEFQIPLSRGPTKSFFVSNILLKNRLKGKFVLQGFPG